MHKIHRFFLSLTTFLILTELTINIVAYFDAKDVQVESEPHKGEFFVVLQDQKDKKILFLNMVTSVVDSAQYSLYPNDYDAIVIKEMPDFLDYSYKILDKTDGFIKIETTVKNDDYTLKSTYSVENNKITMIESYVRAFDYLFFSMMIAFFLNYVLWFLFWRWYYKTEALGGES